MTYLLAELGMPSTQTIMPSPPFKVNRMTASDEGVVRLRRILAVEAKVADEVTSYITDVLKCESVADFAGLFKEGTYHDQILSNIIEKTSLGGNLVQTSRTRLAWELCRSELNSTLKRKAENLSGSQEDLEAPLDEDIRRDIEGSFSKKYNFKFPAEFLPSAALYGRLYREFRRQSLSIHDIQKVKSAAFNQAIMPSKRVNLGGGVQFSLESRETDVQHSCTSPLQFLLCLRILLNGFALCGTAAKDSKRFPGTRVADAELTAIESYYGFVYHKAMSHPGNGAAVVDWLLDRDRRTRSHARDLVIEGWPLGEALTEVVERKMAVLWEFTTSGPKLQEVPSAQQGAVQSTMYGHDDRSPRKPKFEEAQASDVCGAWNDHRGCTNRQKDCPHGKLHRCSRVLPSGLLCGAWQHNKLKCGDATSKSAVKGSPKGKPKGRGKGKGSK